MNDDWELMRDSGMVCLARQDETAVYYDRDSIVIHQNRLLDDGESFVYISLSSVQAFIRAIKAAKADAEAEIKECLSAHSEGG